MNRILTLIIMSFAFLSENSFSREGEKKDESCFPTGLSTELVCAVSMTSLISDPSNYNGKLIRVRGYISSGIPAFLFLSKEAHDASDISSSILVSSKKLRSSDAAGIPQNWVEVIGRFSSDKKIGIPEFVYGAVSVGMIGSALHVQKVGIWGTENIMLKKDEIIEYLEGLDSKK